MSDRVPIVYDTNEIGKRLKELERQRWGDRPKSLALPPDVIIVFADDQTKSYPANVGAVFMLYESRTKPILALTFVRDARHTASTFMRMVECLREDFPSATPTHEHRIVLTVQDAARLAERLRAARE